MAGQDVVYANLAGRMEEQAKLIVQTMERLGLKRLIFVSSMGIYDEVPGESFHSALIPYRSSAEIIEQSTWTTRSSAPRGSTMSTRSTTGRPRRGSRSKTPRGVVSRKSVADLVVKLATTPGFEIRRSLGVHKGG